MVGGVLLREQLRQDQEVVGKYGHADEDVESGAPAGETAPHATTAHEDGDAALDAGAKALGLF